MLTEDVYVSPAAPGHWLLLCLLGEVWQRHLTKGPGALPTEARARGDVGGQGTAGGAGLSCLLEGGPPPLPPAALPEPTCAPDLISIAENYTPHPSRLLLP